jgi:hypothetical protein
VVTNLSCPLHGEADSTEVSVTVFELQTGSDAVERAERCESRRIARAAIHVMNADNVFRFVPDQFHVFDVRANVFRDDEAAAQRIDVTAQGAQQCFALIGFRIPDDDGAATAEIEAGDRGLVGHILGMTQHIAYGVGLARVRPHSQTAERRAQQRAVDADHTLQA